MQVDGMVVPESIRIILILQIFLPPEIATEIKSFGQSTSVLFDSLHSLAKSAQVNPQIDELKDKLYKITSMIGDLTNNNDEIDQLGDMVEKELSGMDKAIEEVI